MKGYFQNLEATAHTIKDTYNVVEVDFLWVNLFEIVLKFVANVHVLL